MCPAGMSLPMLLQTYRHNFLDQVEIRMGAVKPIPEKNLLSKLKQLRSQLKSLSRPYLKVMGYEQQRTQQDAVVLSNQRERNHVRRVFGGKLLQKSRRLAPASRSSSFLRSNIPSKMSRWLQYSICSKKVIS